MNVADAMTTRSELVTVELPGTRDDVLEYLQEHGFSSVPVVKGTDDGEAYRGLVSRDALIEHPDEDQLALLVEEVPTTTVDATLLAVPSTRIDASRAVSNRCPSGGVNLRAVSPNVTSDIPRASGDVGLV